MIFKALQVENYCKRLDMNIKAFLAYGSNEGLISEYIRKLTLTVSSDLNDPFAVVNLNWDEVKRDVGLLISEYNAQSLLSTRRVIILHDADNDLTKVLESFIEDSKSDTLLLVSGSSSLNNRSSLVNYFSNEKFLSAIACYDDREEDISTSARQFLAKEQITYTKEAFELLCSRLSNDRKSNINEIDKLITYVGSKKHFEIEDVRKLVLDSSSTEVDDLCFYVFSGLKTKAIGALKNLLNEGTEEVQIIRALSRHINILLDGKALMEDGLPASEVIKKVLSKRLFYRYNMGEAQLTAWSKDRLFDAYELLYKAEKDCKTTNYPNEYIIGYLILTLTAAAGKLMAKR